MNHYRGFIYGIAANHHPGTLTHLAANFNGLKKIRTSHRRCRHIALVIFIVIAVLTSTRVYGQKNLIGPLRTRPLVCLMLADAVGERILERVEQAHKTDRTEFLYWNPSIGGVQILPAKKAARWCSLGLPNGANLWICTLTQKRDGGRRKA